MTEAGASVSFVCDYCVFVVYPLSLIVQPSTVLCYCYYNFLIAPTTDYYLVYFFGCSSCILLRHSTWSLPPPTDLETTATLLGLMQQLFSSTRTPAFQRKSSCVLVARSQHPQFFSSNLSLRNWPNMRKSWNLHNNENCLLTISMKVNLVSRSICTLKTS